MAFDDEWPIGAWEDLAARLDAAGALARWATVEPQLTEWSSVAELRTVVRPGADRNRVDSVMGSLVRLAARDGGDDPDAVLVVLHLLRPGVYALAERFAGMAGVDEAPIASVLAELSCRIRTFPWQRRSRSIPGNLLLDAKHKLWMQHCRLTRADIQPVEPRHPLWEQLLVDSHDPLPAQDLADLFDWAASVGLVPASDLELLLASERDTAVDAGAAFGVHARTVGRRRRQTLQVLRQAGRQYLAA